MGIFACLLAVALIALAGWPSPAGAYTAYVSNESDHDTAVIDTTTNAFAVPNLLTQIQPWGVAIHPNQTRAYVASFDTVYVINTQTNTVATSIDVGNAAGRGIALTPDGARAYMVNAALDSVTVIDTATNTVVGGTIAVGNEPNGIAIASTPLGVRAYVANDFDSNVSVIDPATDTVTATIPVGSGPQGVAFTPDGLLAYVTNFDDDTLSVIDTQTQTVVGVPIVVGAGTNDPKYIAIAPDGSKAYVGSSGSDTVTEIDLGTNMEVSEISVGDFPHEIEFTPDGSRAYVANAGGAADVSVIDTATDAVVDTIDFPMGSAPTGVGIADVPPIAPLAAPLPDPVVGKTVNVEPVSGTVRRRCPGESGFSPLTMPEQVAVGCLIDTRKGTVRLTSARGSGGGTQSADFWDGLFRVNQKAGANPFTELVLKGSLGCGKSKKGSAAGASSGARAQTAGAGGRRLWGSGQGSYRTRGNRGAGAVRGTTWLVADRCNGSTLFKVTEGVVTVRDDAKKKSITLRKGKSYVAKGP